MSLVSRSANLSYPVVYAASTAIPLHLNSMENNSMIDYSIPGNRLAELPDGSLTLIPKTPAEIIGEKVLRPMIDVSIPAGRYCFGFLKYGFNTLDSIISRVFNFLPGAEARPSAKNSGLNQDRFVVAHDNKGDQRLRRLGVVDEQGNYWKVKVKSHSGCEKSDNSKPCVMEMQDLESITKVQGQKNKFITCTSGDAYIHPDIKIKNPPMCFYFDIKQSESKEKYLAQLIFKFQLPTPDIDTLTSHFKDNKAQKFATNVNIEAFALSPPIKEGPNKGKHHAVWAHRGVERWSKDDPRMYRKTWLIKGIFDLRNQKVTFQDIRVIDPPFPLGKRLRRITDLFVDKDGTIFASAAVDEEPTFRSRIYKISEVDRVVEIDIRPHILSNGPVFPFYKIEAICQNSKGELVLGVDNEKGNKNREAGGLICNTNRDCKSLKIDSSKKEEHGISGMALLDDE